MGGSPVHPNLGLSEQGVHPGHLLTAVTTPSCPQHRSFLRNFNLDSSLLFADLCCAAANGSTAAAQLALHVGLGYPLDADVFAACVHVG
eukprot:6448619-Prorocentrum_lima.AAC.1